MADRKPTPTGILDDLMSKNPIGPQAQSLRIADIRRDGGTQPRSGLDEGHVQDLVAAIENGATLPPVDVTFDGSSYWLYDGYHRTEAVSRRGLYTVMAIVHQGTLADAQWASYSANASHGLKRTNEDKRRQVMAALRHTNATSLSNVQIAQHVGVNESTVRSYRAQMEATSGIPKSDTRTGADGRTINTANIGATQREYAEVWQLERVVSRLAKEWDTPPDTIREAAHRHVGSFWTELAYRVKDFPAHRANDLVQAMNNVAAQIEAAANGTNFPAGDPYANREKLKAERAGQIMPLQLATPTPTTDNHAYAVAAGLIPAAPEPVRYVTDAKLYEIADKAYSGDILSSTRKMRKPFTYADAIWTCVSGSSEGSHPENNTCECIRIHPSGEMIAPGEPCRKFVRGGVYDEGSEVTYGGLQYVMGAQWLIVQRGVVAADAQPVVTLDELPVVATATGVVASGINITRLDQLYALHRTYQSACNHLTEVVELMPEAAGVVRMVDAALRKLVERLDAELTNE